jgi:hypothetical protein
MRALCRIALLAPPRLARLARLASTNASSSSSSTSLFDAKLGLGADADANANANAAQLYDVAADFAQREMLPHAEKWDRDEVSQSRSVSSRRRAVGRSLRRTAPPSRRFGGERASAG